MIPTHKIALIVASSGVSLKMFWAEAMGGDMAPMLLADVLRVIKGIKK